ncbi:MAG: toprim domain-containing protein, partial [Bacteroidales bacterium]|nr:toprim domain-containing protein [Bacteroidales bacterium]
MADNPISSFPIAELLKALGARPGNRKDTFHSPFRVDKDASLHINPDQNVWYDHGAGVGGGNIDLVMRCKGCTARQAARFIRDLPTGALVAPSGSSSEESPEGVPESGSSGASEAGASGTGKSGERYPLANRILMIRDLHSPYLVGYCESRGIPAALAARYCKEIVMRGKKFGKTYDHIAFPNNVGGYALKAPSGFKCTTKGGITTIDMAGTLTEEPSTGTVTLFEGFFDFLSWLAKDNRELPATDVCVLNSVSNLGRSLPYLKKHTTIICCLDNDAAGREALETLR